MMELIFKLEHVMTNNERTVEKKTPKNPTMFKLTD